MIQPAQNAFGGGDKIRMHNMRRAKERIRVVMVDDDAGCAPVRQRRLAGLTDARLIACVAQQ